MNKILVLLVIFLALQKKNFSQEYKEMIKSNSSKVDDIIFEAEKYFENGDKGKGTGYKQYKRWEYLSKRLENQEGYLKSNNFYLNELSNYNKKINRRISILKESTTSFWEELGPFSWNTTTNLAPGLGRITSIAVDVNNQNHIIVGSQTGGVWSTSDEGKTWKPLNDTFGNMNVYSLEIDHNNSNVFYWGSDGGELYKTINSGATWELVGSFGFGSVIKISINPINSNIIFVACENNNVFKSSDAGQTWEAVLDSSKSGDYDIEFKPNDPMTVYLSGTRFYKSTDGGENFIEVNGFDSGVKMIAVSESDSEIVYVLEESSGSYNAIYKSNDSGNTFSKVIHNSYTNYLGGFGGTSGQAPRDMDIVVSPKDINEIHIAGINTWRSLDGGISFKQTSFDAITFAKLLNIGYCHVDVDIMIYQNDKIYVGTDGGVFIIDKPKELSSNYYRHIGDGLGIKQIYRIGVSQTNPIILSLGSQDNGSSHFHEINNEWRDWINADGMETFIDKDDPTILYGTSQFGTLYRGDGYKSLVILDIPTTGNWVTPVDQDHFEPNTFYVGYNKVYKFTDKGEKYIPISQQFSSKLNHVDVARSNNKIIYASYGSNLYKTTDGGKTDWIFLTNSFNNINDIAVHPIDPNKIVIATTNSEKVFLSNDGGITWESIKYDLPSFSSLTVLWQESEVNGIYLGMNFGVYFLEEGTKIWKPFRNNLPNVIINELEINYSDNKLYAGTYGRGVWRSTIYGQEENQGIYKSVEIYPNPVDEKLNIKWNDEESAEIIIYNSIGQIVFYSREKRMGSVLTIGLSFLATGNYIVNINSKNYSIKKKIIKI